MRRYLVIALLAIGLYPFVLAQQVPGAGSRKIARRVPPVYPDLARRLNLEGLVKLRVTVASDGAANATEVLGGNPVLAKSAQDAVSTWKWVPAEHETKEIVELRFHRPGAQ